MKTYLIGSNDGPWERELIGIIDSFTIEDGQNPVDVFVNYVHAVVSGVPFLLDEVTEHISLFDRMEVGCIYLLANTHYIIVDGDDVIYTLIDPSLDLSL